MKGTAFPPQIPASIAVDHVFRFTATEALAAAEVTCNDLFDLLVMAITTTAARRINESVRVCSVEMWCPPSSTGASTVLALEEGVRASGISSPSRRLEDVTMGQDRPAHVRWSPKSDSWLSNWLPADTGVSFILTGPAGTTLDVHLRTTIADGTLGGNVGASVAGATAGRVYIRALNSNGANTIPPVSYQTI